MKVGFLQNHPIYGDKTGTLNRLENQLTGQQADLIVLPELCATGYQFSSLEEARELSEPIPDGPTINRILKMAKYLQGVIVAGIGEREGSAIYNSAVMVSPDGIIGKYRKVHLFDTEKRFFQPGDQPLPVFETARAKIGIMICFDWRFPETTRSLALKGAEIVAHPSNLVLPHCPQSMIVRCLENRIFAITANRIGIENRVAGERLEFIGQSQVVDPDGNLIHRASQDDEEIKLIEIDPSRARDKTINSVNDLFTDRRTDLYELN